MISTLNLNTTMKLKRATNYLLLALHFMEGAVRSAILMHTGGDFRPAFGGQRALRAANARACLREWRWHTLGVV